MLLGLLLIFSTCKVIESTNVLINNNATITLHDQTNSGHAVLISQNSSYVIVVEYPFIYYAASDSNVDTIHQYDVISTTTTQIATNFLSISGMVVRSPTLIVLEMGNYNIDISGKIHLVSLDTKKQKIVKTITRGNPRSLHLDINNRDLYYSLDTGDIMKCDVASWDAQLLVKSDFWATGLSTKDNVLFVYSNNELQAFDLTTKEMVYQIDVSKWGVSAITGLSLAYLQNITRGPEKTEIITKHNETYTLPPFPTPLITLVLFDDVIESRDNVTDRCAGCDLCLPGPELGCGCVFGRENGTCLKGPRSYLVITQITSLTLIDLADPASPQRLSFNNDLWWMRDVRVDYKRNTVYWIESMFSSLQHSPESSRIITMKLDDPSSTQVVQYFNNLRPVISLALNPESGLVYWLISKLSLVVAAKMGCSPELCYKSSIITRDLDETTCHLEVSNRFLVYVTGNNEIVRRDLDGANPKVILSSNIHHISALTVSNQYVYLITSDEDRILQIPLLGGESEAVFRRNEEFIPISMTVQDDEVVYVVSELLRTITQVNLTTRTSSILLRDLVGMKSISSSSSSSREVPCERDNGGCQHFCFNTPKSSFRCGCPDGFILSEDLRSCQEPPELFLAMGGWVQRVNHFTVLGNSSTENILYHNSGDNPDIVGADYFEQLECLVWIETTSKTISKSYLSGRKLPTTERTAIVYDGLFDPTDISVDWISQTVYWSDKVKDSISMVTLSGSLRREVVKYAHSPTSLVVHPTIGKMFWIGWEPASAVIRSSDMAGGHVETLHSRLSTWPTDITIDYQNNKIVWIDAKDFLVVSSDFDGANVRFIFGTPVMGYPVSLALWRGFTYWADKHMWSVYVADGSNAFDVEIVVSKYVSNLVLSHKDKQRGSNACSGQNGGCSHVCVPTSSAARDCLCPTLMVLHSDGTTCIELAQQMLGVDVNPYLLSVGSPPARLSHQQLHDAVSIAVNYEHQAIYWLDNDRSTIEMVHLNGTGYKVLYKGTFDKSSIQVDWLSGLIFWVEHDPMVVKCARVDGEFDKTILFTDKPPRFLLLDPPKSLLFWVECQDNKGFLYQSTTFGANQTLLLNITTCPLTMDISRDTSTIFWVEPTTTARAGARDNTTRGNMLHMYHYDSHEVVDPHQLMFYTLQITWVEGTIFLLFEDDTSHVMIAYDVINRITRPRSWGMAVGNTTMYIAYSPLDQGYSQCQVDNGGCTHFCFHLHYPALPQCGCPAEQTLLADNRTCTRQDAVCDEEQFRCRTGECISEELVCSSHEECLDGSDEIGCGWCESYEFSCGDKCIRADAVCDGVLDCDDRSDESRSLCMKTCSDKSTYEQGMRYMCKGTGVCLPSSMKCNGVVECEMGDDEKKCPRTATECNELEWQCDNGMCIHRTWLCDRHPDCPGGEDEQGCAACDPDTQFDCGNTECIPLNEVCDGLINCMSDGRDELNCNRCRKGQYQCNNGQCRAANRWCDRTPDCSDKSDEWNCTYSIVEPSGNGKQDHIAPTLFIIFGSLVMSIVVVWILYRFNVLPKVRSTYKQLTQSSNKTVETNVCVTTNTYSELETTVCSSEGAWQRQRNKSLDYYETITNSSVSSCLKPINTQNPYERFGIAPVRSTTDVSIADGPPPSTASGGYSSGPGSHAPSARSGSRAVSARSRGTSGARSRIPVSYHVNSNVIWDDHINSVSDYEQSYMSDAYQSDNFSMGFPSSNRPLRNTTPITTDNED